MKLMKSQCYWYGFSQFPCPFLAVPISLPWEPPQACVRHRPWSKGYAGSRHLDSQQTFTMGIYITMKFDEIQQNGKGIFRLQPTFTILSKHLSIISHISLFCQTICLLTWCRYSHLNIDPLTRTLEASARRATSVSCWLKLASDLAMDP